MGRAILLVRLASLLILAGGALSCTESSDTWIVVKVMSDRELSLSSVRMSARSALSAAVTTGAPMSGKTADFGDPYNVTWSLFPDNSDKTFAIEIEARGLKTGSSDPVVIQKAVVSFEAHRQKTIILSLEKACLGVSCSAALTCQHGRCVDPGSVGTADAGSPDAPADAPTVSPGDGGDTRRDVAPGDDVRTDAGATDAGTSALGTACRGDSECGSSHCVDGVCCNEACTGSCQQCDSPATPGQCVAVAAGQPAPTKRAPCAPEAVATCKQNGMCDGKGSCQLYPDGAICKPATCDPTANNLTESRCDGMGTCKAGTPLTCAPFRCKSGDTQCARSCSLAADCDGQSCLAGSCGKLGNGAACASDDQCQTGFCVDSVCCSARCAGQCQACNLSTSVGTCSNVKSGQPVGGRAACTGTGTCGGSCNGAADCTYPIATLECRAASCAVATLTASARCSGTGTCPAIATSTCAGHLRCQAGTALCLTMCAGSADCMPGFYCANQACVAAKAAGAPCVLGEECTTGLCTDGVCCNSTCAASCQTCASVAMPGTCTTVSNADDPGTCSGTNTCNVSGSCLKRVGQTCAAGTECASGSCVDRVCCNTACAGACQSCTTGTCTPVTNGDDADSCTGSMTCNGQGACVSKSGQQCTTGTQCSSGLCVDQRCCNTACNQPCQTCVTGTCMPVTSGDDAECSPTTSKTCSAAGTCLAKLGQACTGGAQCASGQCVDGMCCNTACTDSCKRCDLIGSLGTCSTVTSAEDNTCTGGSICNATGACTLKQGQSCTAGGTACVTGQCVDGRCCNSACTQACQSCALPASLGTCTPVASADDPECSPTATRTCSATSACLAKLGQSCTMGNQCASGFCADGVCCNAACNRSCEACSTTGTCGLVTGTPRTGHAPCTGSDMCASTCNGSSPTCVLPPATTSCRSQVCSAGTLTLAATCGGADTCPGVTTRSCAPFACASATACATTCGGNQTVCNNVCVDTTVDKQNCGGCRIACESYQYCHAGKCTPTYAWTRVLPVTPLDAIRGVDSAVVGSTGDIFVKMQLSALSNPAALTFSNPSEPPTQISTSFSTLLMGRYTSANVLKLGTDFTFGFPQGATSAQFSDFALTSTDDVMLGGFETVTGPNGNTSVRILARLDSANFLQRKWAATYPSGFNVSQVFARAPRNDYITLSSTGPGRGLLSVVVDNASTAVEVGTYFGNVAALGSDKTTMWFAGGLGPNGPTALNPWSPTTTNLSSAQSFIIGTRDNGSSFGPWLTTNSTARPAGLWKLAVTGTGDLIVLAFAGALGNGAVSLGSKEILGQTETMTLFKLATTSGTVTWKAPLTANNFPFIAVAPDGAAIAVLSQSSTYTLSMFSDADGSIPASFIGSGQAQAIAAGGNSLYVLGTVSGSADFNPGSGIDIQGNLPGIFITRFSY
ncbi:MAG TPA: hypothetical protein VFH68_17545 [Polyangia bacterium]|nr:hypothetical protein [Polyangia bacterium]